MEKSLKRNMKNILYTVWANGVSTLISIVLSLVIPKMFNVTEYGMWQLYSFYIAYVGVMHLGWTDGIYLQFGGVEYKKLPKQYLSNQFWALNLCECILSFGVIVGVLTLPQIENSFIWIGFAICFLVNSARMFILLVYQASNRIKEYSKYLKLDRYIFFVLTIIGIIGGIRQYYFLILFDLIGKVLALVLSIRECKDYILLKPVIHSMTTVKEAIKNISIGSKLTFGGLATSLVIGILRQSIQMHWGIDVFAKISFTLNISNIIMIFVNTIGQVLFPILRTIDAAKYKNIFRFMRELLSMVLLIILGGYFIASPILIMWLPEYEDGLKYMALLFPVYVFESKSALLYTSFFKTIRKEKWVFAVNIISLLFCAVTVPVAVFAFDNLFLSVLFYVIAAWIRNIISDILASKYMKVEFIRSLTLESVVLTVFMSVAWSLNAGIGLVVYLAVLCFYGVMQHSQIKNVINFILPQIRAKLNK